MINNYSKKTFKKYIFIKNIFSRIIWLYFQIKYFQEFVNIFFLLIVKQIVKQDMAAACDGESVMYECRTICWGQESMQVVECMVNCRVKTHSHDDPYAFSRSHLPWPKNKRKVMKFLSSVKDGEVKMRKSHTYITLSNVLYMVFGLRRN